MKIVLLKVAGDPTWFIGRDGQGVLGKAGSTCPTWPISTDIIELRDAALLMILAGPAAALDGTQRFISMYHLSPLPIPTMTVRTRDIACISSVDPPQMGRDEYTAMDLYREILRSIEVPAAQRRRVG